MVWQLARPDLLLVGGLLAAAIGIQAVHHLDNGALLLLAAAIGWHDAHAHAATQGDAQAVGSRRLDEVPEISSSESA